MYVCTGHFAVCKCTVDQHHTTQIECSRKENTKVVWWLSHLRSLLKSLNARHASWHNGHKYPASRIPAASWLHFHISVHTPQAFLHPRTLSSHPPRRSSKSARCSISVLHSTPHNYSRWPKLCRAAPNIPFSCVPCILGELGGRARMRRALDTACSRIAFSPHNLALKYALPERRKERKGLPNTEESQLM